MTEYTRAKVQINTPADAYRFVSLLNGDGTADKYILEDMTGEHRVNARSLLGVLYMSGDHCEDSYLVNLTNDGMYPHGVDQYRS